MFVLFYYRSFTRTNTGPAQTPNINRYLECIVSRLYLKYPYARTIDDTRYSRSARVLKAYEALRKTITQNDRIIEAIKIQLPQLNNATLTDWYVFFLFLFELSICLSVNIFIKVLWLTIISAIVRGTDLKLCLDVTRNKFY